MLQNKINKNNDTELVKCLHLFNQLENKIKDFIIIDEENVNYFVDLFNVYRKHSCYAFEQRPNSGQELLRSTMLEGFFEMLFKDLVFKQDQRSSQVVCGKANILSGFTFSPFSYEGMFDKINFSTQMKDQDFVIGLKMHLEVKGNNKPDVFDIIVPAIVIECKTYIEKNMLETHENSCANTKSVFPFCKYFIVAEYMKMKTGRPQLSQLDDIYIFTKTKNSDRERRFKSRVEIEPFDKKLVFHLFSRIKSHLEESWWETDSSFSTGRLFKY
jgi:hypothetical protein